MTEPMRDEMHKVWGEKFLCTQNYGMSELCGPGVAGECEELCGMHINEDLVYTGSDRSKNRGSPSSRRKRGVSHYLSWERSPSVGAL